MGRLKNVTITDYDDTIINLFTESRAVRYLLDAYRDQELAEDLKEYSRRFRSELFQNKQEVTEEDFRILFLDFYKRCGDLSDMHNTCMDFMHMVGQWLFNGYFKE